MAELPVFTPRPVSQERDQWGRPEVPHTQWPRCRACGGAGPADVATGLDVECWRVGPWAAAWARGEASEADEWREAEAATEAEKLLRDVVNLHAAGGGDYCCFHKEDVLRVSHWLMKRAAVGLVAANPEALKP